VSGGGAESREVARDLAISRQAQYMTAMLLEQRRYEKDSILNIADQAQSEAYATRWDKARIATLGSLQRLGAVDLVAEDRESLAALRSDFDRYDQGYLKLLAEMRNGQVRTPADANRLLEDYKPAAHRAEVNGVLLATRALNRLHVH